GRAASRTLPPRLRCYSPPGCSSDRGSGPPRPTQIRRSPLSRPLRLGTRRSALALAQSGMVARDLAAALGLTPDAVELVPIVTTGDRIQDRRLAESGGKALFTR